MTVPTSTAKSGPYAGAGTTGPFTVGFRFLENSHLRVIRTSSIGVDSVLALTTDYTVAGAGGASGSITLVTALAVGEKLTVIRNVPFTQLADYVQNDAFPAESHERALDQLTMQTQQLAETAGRALTLPATVSGASTELPSPEAGKLIGWNSSGDGLTNLDSATLATIVAYGTANGDIFTGDGTTTAFNLTASPGLLENLDVAIGGVTQLPGVDYFWTSGTVVTFAVAPPAGVKVLARYMRALAQGEATSGATSFSQAGSGSVGRNVESKLREWVSVTDYGATGDGVTDDWRSIQDAVTEVSNRGGGVVFFPVGTYLVKYAIDLKSNVHYLGEDREACVVKAHPASIDNIFGKGYPTAEYMPLARAAGGTINRLTKPDFLTNYTEEEALINGGMSGYAVTHALIENLTIDGNKANRQEGNNYLKGTLTGTFLSGETLTSSSGGSAMVTGAFPNLGCVIEPRTITGTFNVGDTITGASSGKTMVIASKEADDAYQLNVRFDGVSHSTVRNCVFRNSIFTAMSLYNASNYNTVEGCLFHNNHKAGTTYTSGYINIYVEFDNNYNIIKDNLLIGGLGYSILVSCSGGVNRDTYIVNNTILNNAGDGIRVALEGGVYTIFAPRVIGNTVVNCTQAGSVGIRFLHNGGGGSITDGVIIGNTVRDCTYGILTQGTVQYTTVSNNTCRNNSSADISVGGVGVVAIGNTADSQLEETLANKLTLAAGRTDPLRLYSGGGQSVGSQREISGIGTWYDSINYPNGYRHFEFGGSRKASISPAGDFEAVNSVKGGRSKVSGAGTISVTTTATTLWTVSNAINPTLFVVSGDNGSAGFSDLVLMAYGTIFVVSSNAAYGSPPARTYSRSSADFKLALASGSLGVLIQAMEFQY